MAPRGPHQPNRGHPKIRLRPSQSVVKVRPTFGAFDEHSVRKTLMRKAILMSSAIIVLAALAFAGTEVWKAKPYQQWDQKDVSKILGDSPWSKIVQVEAPWTIGKSALPDQVSRPLPPRLQTEARPLVSLPQVTLPLETLPVDLFRVPVNPSRRQCLPFAGFPRAPFSERRPAVPNWLASLNRRMLKSSWPTRPMFTKSLSLADMRPFQSADDETLIKSAFLVEKKTNRKSCRQKCKSPALRTAKGAVHCLHFRQEIEQWRAHHRRG